jgi:hypothetical protein
MRTIKTCSKTGRPFIMRLSGLGRNRILIQMAVRFRNDFFPQPVNWGLSLRSDIHLSIASAWG